MASGRSSTHLPQSPPRSDQSSPSKRPWKAPLDDESQSRDKTYRRYASGVERALSLFDTVLQEWADYISFLGRLFKALQAHPANVTSIPYRSVVAKRLAQCLNPSLPSGVHQKALEVYAYIFGLIGSDALSRDLPVYLPGLSSTLSFASLSVRPAYLSILENHLLRTHPSALRPALRAIILALLPALEEETSEDFERSLRILQQFRSVVRSNANTAPGDEDEGGCDEYFWQCFFLASITSSSRRQGALAFLVRKLPRLEDASSRRRSAVTSGKSDDGVEKRLSPSVEALISPEPGLLIRCFAAGLTDDQLLTQRGFLDLLVSHLPLHSTVLQERVDAADLERLVTAAVNVVARKDMSLNRRLWSWFLGPEISSEEDAGSMPSSPAITKDTPGTPGVPLGSPQTRYFEQYGLQPLLRGIKHLLSQNSRLPADRARPFRLCLSLMDRWEVGGPVVPVIFVPALDSIRQYRSVASSDDHFADVLRSASVFFDGVESGLIWSETLNLLSSALMNPSLPSAIRMDQMDLVRFIVTRFNIREEEMLFVHIPLVAVAVLLMINHGLLEEREKSDSISQLGTAALSVADVLIETIPPRAISPALSSAADSAEPPKRILPSQEADILAAVQRFYSEAQGNLDMADPPFIGPDLGRLLLRLSTKLVLSSLRDRGQEHHFGSRSRLLVKLIRKVRVIDVELKTELMAAFLDCCSVSESTRSGPLPFTQLSQVVAVTTSIFSVIPTVSTAGALFDLIPLLVRQAWIYLSPGSPKYHVEVVQCLWHLQSMLGPSDRTIEACVCSFMLKHDTHGTFTLRPAEPGQKFAVLWNHSLNVHKDPTSANSTTQPVESRTRGLQDHPVDVQGVEIMLRRPLFLLLDSLADKETELYFFTRGWLRDLPSIDRIFGILAHELMSLDCPLPSDGPTTKASVATDGSSTAVEYDSNLCLYYLRTLSNILQDATDKMWYIVAHTSGPSQRLPLTEGEADIGQSLQVFFAKMCMQVVLISPTQVSLPAMLSRLCRTALSVLQQLVNNPHATMLEEVHLEENLLQRLLNLPESDLRTILNPFLDVTLDALKLARGPEPEQIAQGHHRPGSRETARTSRLSTSTDREEHAHVPTVYGPSPQLLKCLRQGMSSPAYRPVLEIWVEFLAGCLPLYSDTIFQVLIPLVDCLCSQINQTFRDLQRTFDGQEHNDDAGPESSIVTLLNGLELVLAKGHDRLVMDESRVVSSRVPEQPQGFFGNIVSGLVSNDTPQGRSATANNRLTVLLSFQDSVRICFAIWLWASQGSSGDSRDTSSLASLTYTSLRIRNRVRRMLEHLFGAEALECLETMVEIWQRAAVKGDSKSMAAVISLLHGLAGSRPRNTIPAIFNAIYSRTNPNAIEPMRKSTLTSNLADVDVVAFLIDYARSLEDDAMDEIWTDCSTFLHDVLANPFPHRQTLPGLLEFTAILGEKVDNTNFGEQRKMRRELGDLFVRLLTATFTTKPMGFSQDAAQTGQLEKHTSGARGVSPKPRGRGAGSDDVVAILASIVPNLNKILIDSDRVLGAVTTISTSLISPSLRSKAFPANISEPLLDLLYQLSRISNAQKSWRRDIAEAFNDPRFFFCPTALIKARWLPLLRQWVLGDKDRMPELLSRITAPSTAGIVFGVGASSARLEADKKTQLNLRRVGILLLAAIEDSFVINVPTISEKVVELLSATAASSPSSATRAEVYMVLRALVLRVSNIHLAPLWPMINAELQAAFSSILPGEEKEKEKNTYSQLSLLQACRLLDCLLVIAPEEFQLHEWLFITDTIDAVYRPTATDVTPTALMDQVSETLGSDSSNPTPMPSTPTTTTTTITTHDPRSSTSSPPLRQPLLRHAATQDIPRDDLLDKVLQPFFRQLSISAFESTYQMGGPDRAMVEDELLMDLCDAETFVR
ncbi:MAG: hypothetical protein M1817_002173 [Caeruleum heppii]|nr:MAG: hypothetical protein M1817_002173 [Caeruleum heppii]